MTEQARCEPREADRGREGLYWLQHGNAKPALHMWHPNRHTTYPKYYAPGNWQIGINDLPASEAHAWGWRYLHPLSPHDPADIARLVEAAKDALSGWHYIRSVHGDLPGVGWDRVDTALTTALAAFTAKET